MSGHVRSCPVMSGHVRSCPLKWSRMIKVSRVNKTSNGTAKSSASQSVSSCFFASRAFVHLQRQLISASETLLPETEDLYTILYQSPVCWQMLANCQLAITWCRCSFLNAASTGVAKRVSGQRLQFVTLCHTRVSGICRFRWQTVVVAVLSLRARRLRSLAQTLDTFKCGDTSKIM